MTNLAHYTFLGNRKNIILETRNFSVIFNHCAYFVTKSRGKPAKLFLRYGIGSAIDLGWHFFFF